MGVFLTREKKLRALQCGGAQLLAFSLQWGTTAAIYSVNRRRGLAAVFISGIMIMMGRGLPHLKLGFAGRRVFHQARETEAL